jgi:Arginine repressor
MNHVPTPPTKAARHAAIVDILATNSIGSQEQLREYLAQQGIETAQATLSRDLLELRATKVRSSDHGLVYSVSGADGIPTHLPDGAASKLARWCQELLVGGNVAQNLVVLRTRVGGANLLGSAIDVSHIPGVVGTIAGDDTIFLACDEAMSAKDVLEELLEFAGKTRTETEREPE